ncbi:MAG: hypothetical protein IJ766_00060 [Clostridia bacterium]|nr:hypothetical protein [Clostridia bacterium]
MKELSNHSCFLLFDIKKERIRIQKSTLRAMGPPNYIQLLVSPETAQVAIRGVSKEQSDDQTHRVRKKLLDQDVSYELYSATFISLLGGLIPNLSPDYSYRLYGQVFPTEKLAIYSLQSVERVERVENKEGC